jgi:hypothetical protein
VAEISRGSSVATPRNNVRSTMHSGGVQETTRWYGAAPIAPGWSRHDFLATHCQAANAFRPAIVRLLTNQREKIQSA